MYQTTINDIIKKTAKDTGYDEALVEYIVKYQWKKVKENIEHLDYPYLDIYKLGSFFIKRKRENIYKHIALMIRRCRGIKTQGKDPYRLNKKEPEFYQRCLRNLLKFRLQTAELNKNRKRKVKKLNMILIPMDEALQFSENHLPSEKYTDKLKFYVEKAHKVASSHFYKFPEHSTTILQELTEAFDTCVLQSTFNNEGQYSMEKGIILIDSFRTDDGAVEVGFFIRL